MIPQTIVLLLDTVGLGPKRLKPKKPKSILITGATSGIGENLAIHYAAPGVTLALTGRNQEALQRVSDACKAKGANVIASKVDVVDKSGMAKFVAEVEDKAPLDLVIANAGITEETAGLSFTQLEESAYKVFEVNVAGVFNTIFPALPGMQKRGSGQIVLMSSLAGNGALSGSAAYCGSKSAIKVWGESARMQLQRDGICVNVVQPGYVASPMTQANKFKVSLIRRSFSLDKMLTSHFIQMPNMVSMEYAIKTIISGLARNEGVIAFPAPTVIQTWYIGSIPSQIKDWISASRLIGVISYWGKKKAAKPAAAKKE